MSEIVQQIAEKVVADTKYFSAVIGFVGVVVGAITTMAGNFLLYKLNAKKEVRQEILRHELDRLYALEELAGEITEWAGSYQLSATSDELMARFHKFKIAAGTFRKYPDLKQSIRDLNQWAMILVDKKQNHENDQNIRQEIEEKYGLFIKELNKTIEILKT